MKDGLWTLYPMCRLQGGGYEQLSLAGALHPRVRALETDTSSASRRVTRVPDEARPSRSKRLVAAERFLRTAFRGLGN